MLLSNLYLHYALDLWFERVVSSASERMQKMDSGNYFMLRKWLQGFQ